MTPLPEYAIQAGAEALAKYHGSKWDDLFEPEAEAVLRAAAEPKPCACRLALNADATDNCRFCRGSGTLWILRSTPSPNGGTEHQ